MVQVSSAPMQEAGNALTIALQILLSNQQRFVVRIILTVLSVFVVKWIFWDSKVRGRGE